MFAVHSKWYWNACPAFLATRQFTVIRNACRQPAVVCLLGQQIASGTNDMATWKLMLWDWAVVNWHQGLSDSIGWSFADGSVMKMAGVRHDYIIKTCWWPFLHCGYWQVSLLHYVSKHTGLDHEHNWSAVSSIVHSVDTRKLVCNERKSIVPVLSHIEISWDSVGTRR